MPRKEYPHWVYQGFKNFAVHKKKSSRKYTLLSKKDLAKKVSNELKAATTKIDVLWLLAIAFHYKLEVPIEEFCLKYPIDGCTCGVYCSRKDHVLCREHLMTFTNIYKNMPALYRKFTEEARIRQDGWPTGSNIQ